MEKDIDVLIHLFEKYTRQPSTTKDEIGEQEGGAAEPSSGGGGGGGKNNVSKWADVVGGPKRGVANPVKNAKWSDTVGGPTRGVANQLT